MFCNCCVCMFVYRLRMGATRQSVVVQPVASSETATEDHPLQSPGVITSAHLRADGHLQPVEMVGGGGVQKHSHTKEKLAASSFQRQSCQFLCIGDICLARETQHSSSVLSSSSSCRASRRKYRRSSLPAATAVSRWASTLVSLVARCLSLPSLRCHLCVSLDTLSPCVMLSSMFSCCVVFRVFLLC